MTTEGFLLYTDVQYSWLDSLPAGDVLPMAENAYERLNEYRQPPSPEDIAVDQSAKSLYLTVAHIMDHTPMPTGDELEVRHGFTEADRQQTSVHAISADGFATMHFTWHFSAGLANTVAGFLVDEGAWGAQQKQELTLGNWASMMTTRWFGDLSLRLAITAPDVYATFGQTISDYHKGALQQLLMSRTGIESGPLFRLGWEKDAHSNDLQPTVRPSKVLTRALHERMNKSTKGCPVARYAVTLPREAVTSNPHAKALLDRATLRVIEERSTDDKVLLSQDTTAIQVTQQFIAEQLVSYEKAYGTPVVIQEEGAAWPRVDHVRN